MRNCLLIAVAGIFCLAASGSRAETKVTVDYHSNDDAAPAFSFKTVPGPSANDAATSAKFFCRGWRG